MSISVSSQSFTVPVATIPTSPLVAAAPGRRLLILAVTGVAPCTFKFGSAPQNATDGITLGAASVSGEQGGSLLLTANDTPIDAIYAYSTLGTTVTVSQGNAFA